MKFILKYNYLGKTEMQSNKYIYHYVIIIQIRLVCIYELILKKKEVSVWREELLRKNQKKYSMDPRELRK